MPLKVTQDESLGVNLTPMIDVVFLLVIFFMVATEFSEIERSIDLHLPTAAQAGEGAPPPQTRVVTIYQGGRIELDGRPVSLAQLAIRLSEGVSGESNRQVEVRGDGRCDFQHIAAAMAACREAGVLDLAVTVEVAAAGASTRR